MQKLDIRKIYDQTKATLKESNIENHIFESKILIEHFLDVNSNDLIINADRLSSPTQTQLDGLNQAILRRLNGEPLQYIIGKWDFFGLEFFVGDGVLIPRQDTETIVEQIIKDHENSQDLHILDLCSGSGAIAISLAKNLKNSFVFAIEKSEKAYSYLKKNIEHNNSKNITPILDDVLRTEFIDEKTDFFHIIVSNPPYIKTAVIKDLQKEVHFEPEMALDGGEDGLIFYREITKQYKKCLRTGGKLYFEIGYDQEQQVMDILTTEGYKNVKSLNDYSDNPRLVYGEK